MLSELSRIMVTKICVDCAESFEAPLKGHARKVRCRPCFRKHRYTVDCRRLSNRWAKLRYRAKRHGVALTLSREDWEALIARPCHYCGGDLQHTGSGLDRKDPQGDYSAANVVPCCHRCNTLKQHRGSYADGLARLERLADHVVNLPWSKRSRQLVHQ